MMEPYGFIQRDGVWQAGTHLLIDLWGSVGLDDPAYVEKTLIEAAKVAGATVLHAHTHHFSPNGGVSGVVVLAESHLSIHSWPELGYAAIDAFMCGAADPWAAVPVLREAFSATSVVIHDAPRGVRAPLRQGREQQHIRHDPDTASVTQQNPFGCGADKP